MTEAHVFITDDTLRKALHETIDTLREGLTLSQRSQIRCYTALQVANEKIDALRTALEAAPDPTPPGPVLHGDCYCVQDKYEDWYNGQRQTTLKEE